MEERKLMKKLMVAITLTAIAMFAIACGSKPEAAKPTNANTTPAVKPAETKPAEKKAEVKPTSTAADGDNVYTHADAGIQFEVPKDWKVDVEDEVLTATAADSSVSISFWVPKEASVDQALEALDTELGKVMKDIKTTSKAETGKLNGMTTHNIEGTATYKENGANLEWSAHLIEAKKAVYALTFAAPGMYDSHKKEIDELASSIKKVE
jgi:predicted Zn-dependent protease